uniref:Ig-like domain-containing protein n=1 Tax=Varanus komodoensis TaxID=61221 RepID=A0A8D2JHX8_VARKO
CFINPISEFIRVWPEKLVVESGGFVVLNCSSNCDGIGLETSLNQVPAGNGRTWKAFNLTSVNQWAPTPLCYAQCTSSNIQPQRAEITVYQAPKHVVLDPVPEMEVGKPYNLTCRVSSVAPIRNLIVTLLKGGEELLVETFENHTVPAATDALVTHQIIAQQDDHRAEITCHAALDLRPEGPLFERASDNESLVSVGEFVLTAPVPLWKTFFSSDPHLEAPLVMETNTTMAVHCHVSGVFPAEEAQFDLQFAGKSWNLSTSVSGSSVSAQALVSSSSTGEHTLLCTVSLGRVSRRVEKTVNILVNQSVLITCRCNETGCSGTVMHLSDGKHLLVNGHPPFLQYALTTRKEDDGREFTCQVARMVDGHPVAKETLVYLTVFYGPQMNDSSCPTKLTWTEDSEETLTCSAQGNPPPTVECKKGDTSYNIGVQQRVQREHGGIYHCRATNDYGHEVRNVTIEVKCKFSYRLMIYKINCRKYHSFSVRVKITDHIFRESVFLNIS